MHYAKFLPKYMFRNVSIMVFGQTLGQFRIQDLLTFHIAYIRSHFTTLVRADNTTQSAQRRKCTFHNACSQRLHNASLHRDANAHFTTLVRKEKQMHITQRKFAQRRKCTLHNSCLHGDANAHFTTLVRKEKQMHITQRKFAQRRRCTLHKASLHRDADAHYTTLVCTETQMHITQHQFAQRRKCTFHNASWRTIADAHHTKSQQEVATGIWKMSKGDVGSQIVFSI